MSRNKKTSTSTKKLYPYDFHKDGRGLYFGVGYGKGSKHIAIGFGDEWVAIDRALRAVAGVISVSVHNRRYSDIEQFPWPDDVYVLSPKQVAAAFVAVTRGY